MRHPREASAQLLWVGTWLAVTIIGAFLRPDPAGHGTHQQLGLPPCPSMLLFGRPCPGCGLTTSWTALLHGDFATAFSAHAFGPLFYILFTLSALAAAYAAWRRVRWNSDTPLANRALLVTAVLFFSYSAVRFALSPDARTPLERTWAGALGIPR